MNPFRIAKHLVVPEAQHSIPFRSNDAGAFIIGFVTMLPAIDFDHQLRPVAGEICDEMSDRDLSAEMPIAKADAQ